MATVSKIIESKGRKVLTGGREWTVYEAIEVMAGNNVGSLLIVDGDSIEGIFTERDYLRKIALKSRSSRETRVADVMSSPVITAKLDDAIDYCMAVMTANHLRHLPIMDGSTLSGRSPGACGTSASWISRTGSAPPAER